MQHQLGDRWVAEDDSLKMEIVLYRVFDNGLRMFEYAVVSKSTGKDIERDHAPSLAKAKELCRLAALHPVRRRGEFTGRFKKYKGATHA